MRDAPQLLFDFVEEFPDFLQAFSRLEPTPLEQAEALEQLRALENGERIFVVLTEHDAVSVDTPEDLTRVRAMMERAHG